MYKHFKENGIIDFNETFREKRAPSQEYQKKITKLAVTCVYSEFFSLHH